MSTCTLNDGTIMDYAKARATASMVRSLLQCNDKASRCALHALYQSAKGVDAPMCEHTKALGKYYLISPTGEVSNQVLTIVRCCLFKNGSEGYEYCNPWDAKPEDRPSAPLEYPRGFGFWDWDMRGGRPGRQALPHQVWRCCYSN